MRFIYEERNWILRYYLKGIIIIFKSKRKVYKVGCMTLSEVSRFWGVCLCYIFYLFVCFVLFLDCFEAFNCCCVVCHPESHVCEMRSYINIKNILPLRQKPSGHDLPGEYERILVKLTFMR